MGFTADTKHLQALQRMYSDAPKYMRAVTANYLNNLGFGLRGLQQAQIAKTMTVRNKGLLRKFTRVQKTGAVDIQSQRVLVGSLPGERFTGWKENEEGGPSEQNKRIWLIARGGSVNKIVLPTNRANRLILNADSGYGPTEGNRTFGFLAHLARSNWQGLFRLPPGGRYKSGIYKIMPGTWSYLSKRTGRSTQMPNFQIIQEEGKHIDVKKNEWNVKASKDLITKHIIDKAWHDAYEQAIKRMIDKHMGGQG